MIDFPTSPAVNTVVTAPNGRQWKWNGTLWMAVAGGSVVVTDWTWTQSGSNVVNPAYSNVYEIYFPVVFAGIPIVVCNGGDPNAASFYCNILGRFAERFTVALLYDNGSGVTGTARIDWIAHGAR